MIELSTFPEADSSVRLFFVGDIMVHDEQIKTALQPDSSYSFLTPFTHIRSILETPDLTIGNLETVLAGKSSTYQGYPQFNAPDELIFDLKTIGFDILQTTNNHTLDWGVRGIKRTLAMADSAQIQLIGTQKDSLRKPFIIVEKNSMRLAFFAYTYGTNVPPKSSDKLLFQVIDTTQMKLDFQQLKDSAVVDVKVILLHWGNEYEEKANKLQKKLAKWLNEQGMDLIIGSHPHVIQEVEWLQSNTTGQKTMVAYSLGNFISAQRTFPRAIGLGISIVIEKHHDEIIIPAWYYIPFYVEREKGKLPNYVIYPISQTLIDKQHDSLFITTPLGKELIKAKTKAMALIADTLGYRYR